MLGLFVVNLLEGICTLRKVAWLKLTAPRERLRRPLLVGALASDSCTAWLLSVVNSPERSVEPRVR